MKKKIDQDSKKLVFDPHLSEMIKELNLTPPSTDPQRSAPRTPEDLESLLRSARASGASDLLLVVGYPPAIRIDGILSFVEESNRLSGEVIKQLTFPLLGIRRKRILADHHSIDMAFKIENLGRFRCNLHFQQGSPAAAIRLLPSEIPTLQALNLPAKLADNLKASAGLILVTGPAGCGKSSTLAALVGILNEQNKCHIITIEDPVEYVHPPGKAVIEHVEIGTDGPSFQGTLRSALRQDPDVILVGEMRDLETMRMAITAAETGQLILTTLHTRTAIQSIYRIIDVFPADQQEQVRLQLSMSLLCVVTQQLLPAKDRKGRLPAVEILIAAPAIRNLIRKGELDQIYPLQCTQSTGGMRTMERSLAEMVRKKMIAKEEALKCAYHVDEFRKLL
ncbi:type IV pilus twitching motility protein PilT [Acidobacteriota bacterium]